MDEKEQKLRELTENLRKLVPTMIFIGKTEDKHGVLMMASPEKDAEKDAEKRALDLGATIAAIMEQRTEALGIILASVSYFMQMHPEYQARMYEALAKMKQKPLPVPAAEA